MRDDMRATLPIAIDTMKRAGKFHVCGSFPTLTLSNATEIIVPSFKIVIVTRATTGTEK